MFSRLAPYARPVLVNGAIGLATAPGGEALSVMDFTIREGKITEINILADRDRLSRLAMPVLDED